VIVRYRVMARAAGRRTVEVEAELAPDATVGDLADALADYLSASCHRSASRHWPASQDRSAPGPAPVVPPGPTGLSLRAVPKDGSPGTPAAARSLPARRHAPPSGSLVELVAPAEAGQPDDGPSPVSLVIGTGPEVRLPYGARVHGDLHVEVTDVVTVRAAGSGARVTVDGVPALGPTRVAPGTVLTAGDLVAVVRVDGPLRPPGRGPVRVHRPHRRGPPPPVRSDPVALPQPPAAARRPGLPLLTAAVPLLMGAAIWAGTRSPAMAGFVLFSFAFVIASGVEARREHRGGWRFRVTEFLRELDDAAAELAARNDHEVRVLDEHHPPARRVAAWAATRSTQLWSRRGTDPGDLSVRLGRTRRPGSSRPEVPPGGQRDLRERMGRTLADLGTIDAPLVVDLADARVLAVAGGAGAAAGLARALVVQLCGHLGPDRLTLGFAVGDDRADAWAWAAWLPHRHGDGERRLIVVDGAPHEAGRVALGAARDDPTVSVLWVAEDVTEVPSAIVDVVEVHPGPPGDPTATARLGGTDHRLAPEMVDVAAAEAFARASARLRPAADPSHRAEAASLPPAGFGLADVLEQPSRLTDPNDLIAAWRSPPPGLAAPVGRSVDGVVGVDLSSDGPHALVAGTTGAGKSELLRTLLVSAALHHPPDRLTFLLVDYKGGTAFGDLCGLPHSVGLVTDLTPALARRVLVSLRAELRSRAAAQAAPTDAPGDAPSPPALVVVVDEFATLAEEVPGFVDGLVDVARRGRSLGLHLVLATQRPAGVVTESIRANTSLRVALRVADEEDSLDVAGVPDAAHLPRNAPGRAVVRLGNERTFTVQFAHVGAPATPRPPVRCRPLWPPAASEPFPGPPPSTPEPAPTELQAVLRTCIEAARRAGIDPARRPWAEPLPDDLPLPAPAPGEDGGGRLVIGLVDRPELQARQDLVVDLASRGGLLVLGAAGSGRTTALATVAAAARRAGTAVAAIEAGRGLAAAGCTGAIRVDDVERTLRLLRSLHTELRRRLDAGGRHPPAPRWLVVLDGLGALAEAHERINRGEAIDLLARLAADGRAAGIHLAVGAGRRAEVPPGLLIGLDHRILLRCGGADDAAVLGAPPDLADPALPPGRGFCDGHWVQVARPPEHPDGLDPADPVVARLPTRFPADRLPPPEHPFRVAVGLDAATVTPAWLRLDAHHALVVGPPRSGRTAAVDLLATQLSRAPGRPRVLRLDGRADPDGALAAIDALRDHPDPDPTVLAVDDLVDLLEGPDGGTADDALVDLLRPGRPQVRVLATAEADALARCYATSVRLLRSGRAGILLRPDPDLHAPLLHTVLPPHDDLAPVPGRGWLVDPDDPEGPRAVQLALVGAG
jgi:S-DNA-T family DNA segregation ATPase FtsK/SpoIIIE